MDDKKNEHQIIGNNREIKYLILLVITSVTILSLGEYLPNAYAEFTGEVVVYHTFDFEEIAFPNNTSGEIQAIFVNAGTYGHNADGINLGCGRTHQSIINGANGILGGNQFHDNCQELVFGNWKNQDQWKFLIEDGTTDKYTINFWVKTDISGLNPTDGIPILSAMNRAENFGFDLYYYRNENFPTPTTEIKVYITTPLDGSFLMGTFNAVDPLPNLEFETDWTMITFAIDKSLDTATIWINGVPNTVSFPSGILEVDSPTFIDQPLVVGDNQISPFRTQYNQTTTDFGFDDLCIIKDYVFTQSDVDAIYNNGIGTSCVNITTGVGNSVLDIPLLSTFDARSDSVVGGSPFDTSDIPGDFIIGNIVGAGLLDEKEVTNVRLWIEDSSLLTTGKLQAVVLSNITGSFQNLDPTPLGQEIVEAISDSIEFSDPKFQSSDYFVTFNFTNAIINFTNQGILIGINGTGLDNSLILNKYVGIDNSLTLAICIQLDNPADVYQNCEEKTPSIPLHSLMIEYNVKSLPVFNREISSINFDNSISPATLNITKITTGGDALFNFTIAGPTSFGTSINTTSGNGTTGPSTVTPGTYSVQESIPTGWALTTASCNDGFSTFNVDIVTGIIINAGNNIECTFENVVRCNGLPATIVGTTDNDFIEGTPGNDVIIGLGGDDVILGDDGQDTICGGSGQDYITGDGGADTIFGEGGADLLNGRGGDDTIDGGPGDDVIVGRDGNDILRGGGGDDHISGENDNDTIEGNGGIDHLSGGAGNDIIDGNADDDILTGGSGNDNLNGRAGFDACIDTIGTNTITNCEITS